jgi:hypothetical protein
VKPIELLKLWSDLQTILPTVSDKDKAMVVSEILRSLPPAMTSSCPYTYELVTGLLRKELEEARGRQPTEPKDPTPEVKAEVGPGEREGPKVRKVRGPKPV